MSRTRTWAVAWCCAPLLAGCEPDAGNGPPTIRLGRDVCTECGMSIVEERSSAATIATVDGSRAELLWDDIGCMLDWERSNAGTPIAARFVHDHETRSWVDAAVGHFVMSPKIATPMGSGLVAYASQDMARKSVSANGGAVLSWSDLPAARTAWLRSQGRLSAP